MALTDAPTNAGELKLQRLARKRAGAKMGWFIHATVYVLVNTWLALIAASGGRPWHLYPLAGWGVGLALHAIAVWWLGSGATLRESLVERELRRLHANNNNNNNQGSPKVEISTSTMHPMSTPATPIVVHHLEQSRSQRILWLLEELGLPYEIVHYRRDPQTMLAPPELRKIHPLGKSPVVCVDGLTLAESGAIIETLAERYGAGRLTPPPGSPEALRYRYWLHYAEGSAMPPLLLKLVFDRIARAPMPFFARPIAKGIVGKAMSSFIQPQLTLHLNFMEGELAQREWFAGAEFTAADIQLSFPLEAAQARAGLDARYPRLTDWLKRIHARPAYQRALQQGGPSEPLN